MSAVIKGDMTLGMMMAMQYILGQLNGPLSQFISFMQATQDAKISLERLGEIYDRPDEEPDDEPRIRTIPDSFPTRRRWSSATWCSTTKAPTPNARWTECR